MTKSTITRERLEQLADNNTICKVSWDERIELAQIALAAMDSEPVGEFYEDGPLNWYQISDGDRVPSHRRIPLYRHAQPAPTCESITVTDDMAYAFHHALTDSPLGDDDVEDIKAGLRAALVNVFNTQPPPQEVHDEK